MICNGFWCIIEVGHALDLSIDVGYQECCLDFMLSDFWCM